MHVSNLSAKRETILTNAAKRLARFLLLICAAISLLLLPLKSSADRRFQPSSTYYFDAFDPNQKPWNPGQDLNFEEVFKNYEYFEIIFSPSGKEFTANRYIRNSKTDSEQYLINPDGSISKKQQPSQPGAAD